MSLDLQMSGGRLVVLDRAGREAKFYNLAEGFATLGSDLACNIRLMLPAVSPHHATVVVHTHQTLVHNVSEGETLVNGEPVSVAALNHNDVISLGGRDLRWEYFDPHLHQSTSSRPLAAPGVTTASGRGKARTRDRQSLPYRNNPLQYPQRASMPATSVKQVAIVQPQRRDATVQSSKFSVMLNIQRQDNITIASEQADTTLQESTRNRRSNLKSPQSSTTKASQWIESRKGTRSITPLSSRLPLSTMRPGVTPSASQAKVTAEGDTPRSRSAVNIRPAFSPLLGFQSKPVVALTRLVLTPTRTGGTSMRSKSTPRIVKRVLPPRSRTLTTRAKALAELTPVNRARSANSSGTLRRDTSLRSTVLRRTQNRPVKIEAPTKIDHTKQAAIMLMTRHTKSKSPGTPAITVTQTTPIKTPKASSMPKRSYSQGSIKRPTRSDTSLLEVNNSVVSVRRSSSCPSSRKSVMKSALKDPKSARKTESIKFDLSNLENENRSSEAITIDTTNQSYDSVSGNLSYMESPSPKRPVYSRSSRIIEKTLGSPMCLVERSYSNISVASQRRSSRGSIIVKKALESSDVENSQTSVKTASESKYSVSKATKSLRSSNTENYSIVDLVSMDSTAYNTIDSTPFGTPRSNSRRNRSAEGTILSSTPYKLPHNQSMLSNSVKSPALTPENSDNSKPLPSIRVSRRSRSRSRINDSEILSLEDEDSPRTSKRTVKSAPSPLVPKSLSINISRNLDGTVTPENVPNNDEVSTPVLSIQRLLDSSRGSFSSQKSIRKSAIGNRNTTNPNHDRSSRARSKSLGVTSKPDEEAGTVTPTGMVVLVREELKNKHSTAKKPQSKKSIIDDLNQSDIVKELFSSPVKRKLSRSMIEFSQKMFDDDDVPRKLTRNTTIGMVAGAPENSFDDRTQAVTPELFISSLTTPSNSPNLDGIKRLFDASGNELTDVRSVKAKLRTPRTRMSLKNDLTISGTKGVFAKSPKNRLSYVEINDLRRVSGVKRLKSMRKQKSPKNTLEDVRGVKKLFGRSPRNDLRNISGVKEALQINSPRNDLSDMRGVRRMFRLQNDQFRSNVSGVKELFSETTSLDTTFDLLMGKTPVRTYGRAASLKKSTVKPKTRKTKSYLDPLDSSNIDVKQWSKQRRLVKVYSEHSLPIKKRSLVNKSNNESRSNLPIKKRAVHSTPMKNNITLNVSGLCDGRVSPIASTSKTRAIVHTRASKLHNSTLNNETGTNQKQQNSTYEVNETLPVSNHTSKETRSLLKSLRFMDSIADTYPVNTESTNILEKSMPQDDSQTRAKSRRVQEKSLKQKDLQETQVVQDSSLHTKKVNSHSETVESVRSTRSSRKKTGDESHNSHSETVESVRSTRSSRKKTGDESQTTNTTLNKTSSKRHPIQVSTKPPTAKAIQTQVKPRKTKLKDNKNATQNNSPSDDHTNIDNIRGTRSQSKAVQESASVQVNTTSKDKKRSPANTYPIKRRISVGKKAVNSKPVANRKKAKDDSKEVKDKEPLKTVRSTQKRAAPPKKSNQTEVAEAISPNPTGRKTRSVKAIGASNASKHRVSLVIPLKTPAVPVSVRKTRRRVQEAQAQDLVEKPKSNNLVPKHVSPKAGVVRKGVASMAQSKTVKAQPADVKNNVKAKGKETTSKAKQAKIQLEKQEANLDAEKPKRGRKTPVPESNINSTAKRNKNNPVEDVSKVKVNQGKEKSQLEVKEKVETERKKTRSQKAEIPQPSGEGPSGTALAQRTRGKKEIPAKTPTAPANRKRKSDDVTTLDQGTSVGGKRQKAANVPSPAPARVTRAKAAEAVKSTRGRKR
ncbi:unnamed protein product [Leptosia nina]|uniref:FHA domain-containing protein n=1 Tax=Leptosia nina TaxID=320188 RepID=A0AAV1IVB2_9NEOP